VESRLSATEVKVESIDIVRFFFDRERKFRRERWLLALVSTTMVGFRLSMLAFMKTGWI
jgi:hypothetical protein